MKKISLIMALIILLSALFSIPANAMDDDYLNETIDGFTFHYRIIDNKYVEIVDTSGRDTRGRGVNFIPEKLGGYPVTIIGYHAFAFPSDVLIELDDESTFDLVIPDTVTCIREYAFSGNIFLGTVKIPSSVTYIGEGAFQECVSLRKINIPESVNRIEPTTFISCARLKKITLHDGIEKIGDAAFLGCKSLTKLTVPSELNKLGDRAFYHCKSLKSMDFSDTDTILGYQSIGYYNTRGGWDDGYYGDTTTIRDETTKKYGNFKIICNDTFGYTNLKEYAQKNGFKYLVSSSSESTDLGACESGDTRTLYIDRERLTDYKTSNPKIIKLTKKGKLTALKKGTATVKVTLPSGKRYKGTIEVTNDPVLKQKVTKGKKATYKMAKTVSVKQGKTVSVKLFGKAKSIKNQYTSTSKAQIVSKKNDNIIKIKGKTRGTSTVKVKVNGVKTLSLKVKVI